MSHDTNLRLHLPDHQDALGQRLTLQKQKIKYRKNIQILPTIKNRINSNFEPSLGGQNALSENILECDKSDQLYFQLNISQSKAHIGTWQADLPLDENIPLFCSDEFYRILGFGQGITVISFSTLLEAVHQDDRLLFKERIYNHIKAGNNYEMPHRIVTADGIEKVVISSGEIIFDEITKEPLILIGTILDITERRKVNEALEKSNGELQLLFERIDEVFYSVDMERYVLLQMSAACEKVYGYSVAEHMQNPNLWLDIILKEDRNIIYANDAPLRKGENIIQEYRILHKGGSIRWLQTKLTPTLNENGKLIRIDGVNSDITKRKEVEIALKESEIKLRYLIENSSDGIGITNEHLEFTFTSDSLTQITGIPQQELQGQNIFSFFHSDDLKNIQSLTKTLLETPGKPMVFLCRFRNKMGSYHWFECYLNNLLNEPAIKGFVTNFHDITERKNQEDALKASNEELKKSNNELDRFVYSVSHDLRAPLASIMGVIEFTESESTLVEIKENLSMMKDSAKKLDSFILDILDYSRNSRMGIRKEVINFKELLNDVRNNLKYMSSGKSNVEIRINIDNEIPFLSDKSRISIILNNLVSNAIRYHDPVQMNPYVDITIKTDITHANISVSDNGIGINEKYHQSIFNMFYRVSKRSEGSGLGLYIVKETVEKLHGSILLESEPGKGTKFNINLANSPEISKTI